MLRASPATCGVGRQEFQTMRLYYMVEIILLNSLICKDEMKRGIFL